MIVPELAGLAPFGLLDFPLLLRMASSSGGQ
jgi:hypothetical protein